MTEKHDSRTDEEEGESLGLFAVLISSAAHTPYSYDIPGVSSMLLSEIFSHLRYCFFVFFSPPIPRICLLGLACDKIF